MSAEVQKIEFHANVRGLHREWMWEVIDQNGEVWSRGIVSDRRDAENIAERESLNWNVDHSGKDPFDLYAELVGK